MKGRGYLPSADELRAEILRQSDEHYDGVHASGVQNFSRYAPAHWCLPRTIARRFGHSMDGAGWVALVHELTGLPVITRSESQQLRRTAVRYAECLEILHRERTAPARRLPYDPDEYPTGVRCSSARIVDGKVYLLLR